MQLTSLYSLIKKDRHRSPEKKCSHCSTVARLVLRDLVNATVGFETLALELRKPSKSLHRMLSARGNPTMDNLTKIIGVLRKQLGLDIEVHTTPSRAAQA